jgi:hypothetical protein
MIDLGTTAKCHWLIVTEFCVLRKRQGKRLKALNYDGYARLHRAI